MGDDMVKKVSPKVEVGFDSYDELKLIDNILEKEMKTLKEFMEKIEEKRTAEEEVFKEYIDDGELWFTVIPEKIPEEEVD
jgi:hypothetical protein